MISPVSGHELNIVCYLQNMVAEKSMRVLHRKKKEKEKGNLKYAPSLGSLLCFFPKFGVRNIDFLSIQSALEISVN